MVRLTSSDGQEFTISKEVAYQSVLLKNMIEGNDKLLIVNVKELVLFLIFKTIIQ